MVCCDSNGSASCFAWLSRSDCHLYVCSGDFAGFVNDTVFIFTIRLPSTTGCECVLCVMGSQNSKLTRVHVHLTRLETRTKESNACASFLVFLCGATNLRVRMFELTANQSSWSGVSLSMCFRTRKMVNYA